MSACPHTDNPEKCTCEQGCGCEPPIDVKMIPIITGPDLTQYDRMYVQHPGGLRARFTVDTRCTRCNQKFQEGETVTAHCKPNPDDATWEHTGQCPNEVTE